MSGSSQWKEKDTRLREEHNKGMEPHEGRRPVGSSGRESNTVQHVVPEMCVGSDAEPHVPFYYYLRLTA